MPSLTKKRQSNELGNKQIVHDVMLYFKNIFKSRFIILISVIIDSACFKKRNVLTKKCIIDDYLLPFFILISKFFQWFLKAEAF